MHRVETNIIRYYELLIYVSEIVSVGRLLEDKRLVENEKEVSCILVTGREVRHCHAV